jgi:hypothetical protein
MTLNLLKQCVGVAEVDEQVDWQRRRLKAERKLYHTTRMIPRRREELLDGGSLYWVIKGQVQCRQRLTDIVPFTDDEGIGRCRLMLDPEIVLTRTQPRRAFQGWRYLVPADAPADLAAGDVAGLPPEMRAELAELGLL